MNSIYTIPEKEATYLIIKVEKYLHNKKYQKDIKRIIKNVETYNDISKKQWKKFKKYFEKIEQDIEK